MFQNTEEAFECILECFESSNQEYLESALEKLDSNLHENPAEYGGLLAEAYSFINEILDPEKSYFYYFINLSQEGYSIGFKDENLDPPHYCGPVGDFRNEAQVSYLVSKLGFEKAKNIDQKAIAWLKSHNFEIIEFLEK